MMSGEAPTADADAAEFRSFADRDTEFYLTKWPSTNETCGPQGHHAGEPTGVVLCLSCMESHQNIDKIPHEPTCPQRHTHSRYWLRQHTN